MSSKKFIDFDSENSVENYMRACSASPKTNLGPKTDPGTKPRSQEQT